MAPAVSCKNRYLFAGLILIFAGTAQEATASSSWFARPWQTDEGLPNNTVAALAQTPDGYLWIATPVGLARFDGARFEEISLTNYVAEPNRGVLALVPSRSGGLWLAMDRGPILGLNGGTPQAFTAENGLPDQTAEKLAEDGDGNVWVAYRGGTICRLKRGEVTTFGAQQGVPRGAIYSMVTDIKGRVWAAAAQQVCLFRGNQFERILERSESPIRLAAARDGGVWVCAGLRLLKCSELGQVRDCGEFPTQRAGTEPTALLEDHGGAVWIATSYSGLVRFDGTNFESVPTSYRLVLSLAEDREGNLWAGTVGGGLNRIRMRTVELEGEEAGLPIESVQSLSEGTDGTLWATTQNGFLVYRSGGTWNMVSNSPGGLTCVAADRTGAVWAGARAHQLYCWQDGRFAIWDSAQGLQGQILHSLLASAKGELWIGGGSGALQRLRAGKIENFNIPLEAGTVRAMAEDGGGNIWFGSARGSLFRFSGDSVIDETARLSLPRMSIRCLHAAGDGSLWLGYAGWGLGRLKQGRISRVTAEQGLHDDFVSQIIDDGQGWLWYAGDHGFSR